MERLEDQVPLLPPKLLAQVDAAAAAEGRPVREMLREAVELYLRDRRLDALGAPRTPLQAAQRILERRRRHPLPAGETIRR